MTPITEAVERLEYDLDSRSVRRTSYVSTSDLRTVLAFLRQSVDGHRAYAAVPPHGEYGGPIVSVRVMYEDMLSNSLHVGLRNIKADDFAASRSIVQAYDAATPKGSSDDR